jgi:hypothetical protein
VALNVTEETTPQALPTVTGFAAKQAIAALRKRNVATVPLMRVALGCLRATLLQAMAVP